MRSTSIRKFPTSPRTGASFLEFVGFVMALGGGLVLGSLYLGLDLQAAATTLLEKAEIEVPEALSEYLPTSEGAAAKDQEFATAEEEEAEAANDEMIADWEDADDLVADESEDTQEAQQAAPAAVAVAEQKPLTAAEKIEATRTCWSALNEAIKHEKASRSVWMNDSKSWQLFDYLLHRQKCHQEAVETIEQVDLVGVDLRLREHVNEVLAWHRAGATLFERATILLTDAPAGKLSGPFAQSWQSASTQHQMEEKLIVNKHSSVAAYLKHASKLAATAELD